MLLLKAMMDSGIDPDESPALRDLDPEARQAVLAAFRREMQPALDSVTQNGQVVIASHAHVALARP